jgi:hypothetical protein
MDTYPPTLALPKISFPSLVLVEDGEYLAVHLADVVGLGKYLHASRFQNVEAVIIP